MPVQSLGTQQKQAAVSVYGVVPVAATVLVFPSIVHIPALQKSRYCFADDGPERTENQHPTLIRFCPDRCLVDLPPE